MGFVPCWIEKGYYLDGEDGIIMKMKLSSYKFQELDILAEKIERISQKSTEDFNG